MASQSAFLVDLYPWSLPSTSTNWHAVCVSSTIVASSASEADESIDRAASVATVVAVICLGIFTILVNFADGTQRECQACFIANLAEAEMTIW
jgi:hypothetical protein